MLQMITENANAGNNFAFESTLSGRTYVQHIRNWRKHGYTVRLFFLRLKSADEAIARVAQRVAQGGHYIPDDVVRRRFLSGLENFEKIYKEEVNLWQLYDNTGRTPELVAEGRNP